MGNMSRNAVHYSAQKCNAGPQEDNLENQIQVLLEKDFTAIAQAPIIFTICTVNPDLCRNPVTNYLVLVYFDYFSNKINLK